jgi:hypothetical protein
MYPEVCCGKMVGVTGVEPVDESVFETDVFAITPHADKMVALDGSDPSLSGREPEVLPLNDNATREVGRGTES